MKELIKKLCQRLEKEKRIKILFAIENGSRAWRLESKDSDYDVRFVFIRPIEEYIQISLPPDVIEEKFDEKGKSTAAQGAYFDMVGFDIIKFAKMLSSSNPTTIEWLTTGIVYYGKQNEVFKQYAKKYFNKTALYFHYKSMCQNNYVDYLKSGIEVTYKRYLYSLRGLVNAKWVVHKQSVPPIIFSDAVKGIQREISKDIAGKIEEMIKIKKEGKEKDMINNVEEIDNYLENFLKNSIEAPKEKKQKLITELNNELRKIILTQ